MVLILKVLEQYKQLQRRSYHSVRLIPARGTLLAIASCVGSLMALVGCLLALLSRHPPNTSVRPTLSDFGICARFLRSQHTFSIVVDYWNCETRSVSCMEASFNDGEIIE